MYQEPQYEMFSDLDSYNKDGELIDNKKAIEILKDKFGFEPQILFDALLKADGNFNLKTKLNRGSGMARWGDVGEHIALQLIPKGVLYNCDSGQPTLVITDSNIQIIIMSGNDAVGNIDSPISSNCPKGLETKNKIDNNIFRNGNSEKLETWILYYPSRKHGLYDDEDSNLICELARPTSYQVIKSGKIFPTNHDCRLMFTSRGEIQSYVSEFADESVNEDSFEIEYKDASNEE